MIKILKEEDILYQNGEYWVCRSDKGGYEVYKDGITHSTRCAIIGKSVGFERAKAECDKRANSINKQLL